VRRSRLEVGEFPGCHKAAGGPGAGPVGNVEVEAVRKRRVGLGAEVPLAEVGRGVALGPEPLGQGFVPGVESGDRFVAGERFVRGGGFGNRGREDDLGGVAVRCRQAGAGRMQTGKEARPGRRAERIGGVGAGEGHPAGGEPFNVGGFVELGLSVKRGVGPAEVVGQNHEKVRLRRCRCGDRRQDAGEEQAEAETLHGIVVRASSVGLGGGLGGGKFLPVKNLSSEGLQFGCQLLRLRFTGQPDGINFSRGAGREQQQDAR